MKNTFTEQIRRVVVAAIEKYGSAYALSKMTGISQTNIGRWRAGLSCPRSEDVSPIIELMGAELVLPDSQYADYEYIPKHAAKAGAGASLETSEDVEGLYAFRKDWLASMGIHASSSVMLEVTGDSMEPLMYAGDTLLIDKSDIDVRDGMIYVVTLGDELRVKRIFKGLSGIILRSENSKYPDVNVMGADLEMLHIHGRVRWCGKIF